MLGLVDTIQIAVTGCPLFLAAHTVMLVGCSVGTIILLPALLDKNKGKLIWRTCAKSALQNLGSVISTAGCLVLTPIEIIVPEFNIKVLKMQQWGHQLPESEGRME